MDRAQETFEWIVKIIDTCNNDFHFEAIDNLINIHYKNFKNEEHKLDLEHLRANKWNEIHVILK
jgi:hypothetical protein